jgi:hypothetical protein
MPDKPQWLLQVPTALAELERIPVEFVDRAWMERWLKVHRRVAIRLLHWFGATPAALGLSFIIERQRLIDELRRIAEGEDAVAEAERQARMFADLEKTRRMLPGRAVHIPVAPTVRECLWEDVAAGTSVTFKPGEMLVLYTTKMDLIRQLMILAHAAANDYDRFFAAVPDASEAPAAKPQAAPFGV